MIIFKGNDVIPGAIGVLQSDMMKPNRIGL
jgi:hypothetical protein